MKKKLNLLIADDDRFIRRSIERMLGHIEKFSFFEAADSESVLRTVIDVEVDCILLDYYMADITGLELMQRLREKKITAPVIMLTGQGGEELAKNIIKAGAFDYIPKSRLSEQDFPSTLTTMIINAVSHHEEIQERDRAQIALELSEARYRGLVENSPVLIVRFFPEDYMISFVNDYFCEYFDVERISVLGENILNLIPKSSREKFIKNISSITVEKQVAKFELMTYSKTGELWQLWTDQGIFDASGNRAEYQCMGVDITEMKKTEKQLIVQKRYLQSILDSQENMIIVADRNSVHEVNIKFLQFFGFYSPDDLVKNFERIAGLTVEREGFMSPEDSRGMWLEGVTAETSEGLYRLIAFKKEDSENIYYFSVKFSPLSIDSEIFVVEFSDVTAIEERSMEFENRANYDALTKIYNRRRFLELLDLEMKKAQQLNLELSLIFFDIDHFKNINDTYGHNTGDDVLKTLASLVSSSIRCSDIFARWGGEEFLILVESTGLENAARSAEKIRKIIMDHEFPGVNKMTCSFGVTSYMHGEKGEEFIERADSALYRAKESGRNRVIGIRKRGDECEG